MAKLSLDEKYELYESSVQNHESDIDFINKEYRRIFKKLPMSLREDFVPFLLQLYLLFVILIL